MPRRHVEMYLICKPRLAALARKVAKNADSHRNFLVGCAILAFNGKRYKIFTGVNIKCEKGNAPKVCAEQGALSAAKAAGYLEIIAIVVAGIPQFDEKLEKIPLTLPPCKNCRRIFGKAKGVSGETIVNTVHLTEKIAEQRTFAQLLQKYATET